MYCLSPSTVHFRYRWFEVFDTKFSPLHAMMIYAVTTLDVNAVVQVLIIHSFINLLFFTLTRNVQPGMV